MKPGFKLIALVLSAATFSAGCTLIGSGDGRGDVLSLTLTLDQVSYSQEDPVQATLTLRNNGSESRLVNSRMALNQGSAPDAVREIEFIITDPSGNHVPLGARINVRLPQEENFTILAPGQTISKVYELSTFFSFNQSGAYTIQAIYQNNQDPPSGKEAWKNDVDSNTVEVNFE